MRLDHLLSKELTNDWLPVSVTSVGRRVAHGWNINELSTGKRVDFMVGVGYWLWLHGVHALLVRVPLGVLE